MSKSKFENGISYYAITRKIEAFVDAHFTLDSKDEKEDNLREMLLYTIEFPEYMNYYDSLRQAIQENIQSNYLSCWSDPEFQTVCYDWLETFGDDHGLGQDQDNS